MSASVLLNGDSFAVRVGVAWDRFLGGEAPVRKRLACGEIGEDDIEICKDLLSPAFEEPVFSLGFNKETGKAQLFLSPDHDKLRLFQQARFAQAAPSPVLEDWDVLLGRQPSTNFAMRVGDMTISPEETLVWPAVDENGKSCTVSLFNPSLSPVAEASPDDAYWIAAVLVDETIGEIASMACVSDLDILTAPAGEKPVALDSFAEWLAENLKPGSWPVTAEAFLDRWSAYAGRPEQEPGARLRRDVFTGISCCLDLVWRYLEDDGSYAEAALADGVVPGFVWFPVGDELRVAENEKSGSILEFRERMADAVLAKAGPEAAILVGAASGVENCYIDFIAWDFPRFLEAAREVFAEQDVVNEARFTTFVPGSDIVPILGSRSESLQPTGEKKGILGSIFGKRKRG